MEATLDDRTTAWFAAARALLDWLEQHPDYINTYSTFRMDVFVDSKDELADAARTMGRADKEVFGSFFTVRKQFGAHSLDVNAPRDEVCRKVVTGTRHVPTKVIEAHEEEIVEWVCDDALLAPKSTSEAVA